MAYMSKEQGVMAGKILVNTMWVSSWIAMGAVGFSNILSRVTMGKPIPGLMNNLKMVGGATVAITAGMGFTAGALAFLPIPEKIV